MAAPKRKSKKSKALTDAQILKRQRATRIRFATEELAQAVKGLDPAYIEALAIVGGHFKTASLKLQTPEDQPLGRLREAVRYAVFALAGVDPAIEAVTVRLAAELEAAGSAETKH